MSDTSEDGDEGFDAFAVLGLPREVALDETVIDDAWRELGKRWHPDAEGGDAERAAAVNRARELVARPGARLRHWLELHGRSARNAAMPDAMMTLFSEVGASLHGADELLKKRAAATTAMGRAVLATAEWQRQAELQALMVKLNETIAAAIEGFPAIDAAGEQGFESAESTAATLGFLEKWQGQVQERLVALISG